MGVLAKPIPFGDYFLLEKLNTGGMAEVYKAKTFGVEGFERIVAVKKILPSISEDKEFISMFIDEAKIAGQLTHANIAQIYDLGNINDDYYIALEYVAGHDLRVIYDRCVRTGKKLDIGCVCYIIGKICEGLDYAHNKKDANGEPMNIIHRDISPQNILISYEGDCKLIDFGIAKATNKSSATQVGILKGKFSYMSPEQVSGKTNIDRRSDVFALGIVLFEMLTMKRLFLGASDFETLEKIRKVEVSPPTLYNSDIPEELEDIVLKALEKDVTQRYQTAAELHQALQRFMFSKEIFYSAKELSEFMRGTFAQEIALEQKKMEFYKELTRDVLLQSKKPSVSAEDETSFYDKNNVVKMSGVTYEPVSAQPAPKQAIYAELDGFEPPRDNIVYSQKNPAIHVDNLNVKDIVSASVTSGNKPHAIPRKSTATMEPVVVNKGRETLMTDPVLTTKKSNSRNVFIAIVVVLFLLIIVLSSVFIYSKTGKKGVLTFNVSPADVPVLVNINDEYRDTKLNSFEVSKLSTRSETRYRLEAEGYEDVVGTIMADEDGEIVEVTLVPKQTAPTNELRIFVSNEFADVTLDGVKLNGSNGGHNFNQNALTPGEHLIRVSKPGYKTIDEKINIDKNQQLSKTFDLRPALAAIVIKTEPYSTRFELKNLATGETKTGNTGPAGFRIENLPVDDTYSIVIFDGSEKLERQWIPDKDRSQPNEDQIKVFAVKSDPNAVQAPAAAPAPAPSRPAQPAQPAQPKKPAAPKAETPKAPAEPVAKPAPAPAANTDAPGIFQIAAKPPCDITINGKSYGSTPKKVELPAGSYKITCSGADRQDEKSVSLGGGEVKKVMFSK